MSGGLVRGAGRAVAAPRASLTARACRWAIQQLRREHASVNGIRRQLGCGWRTVWEAIAPLLTAAAADESRFVGVTHLGVDEHVWHHVSTKPIEQGGRGPKELTGMVDLTPNANGHATTRLLDLVPGRSGKAYQDWLDARGQSFRSGVTVATLDPFHGYKNAIDERLEDARAVLDAFHVVKLANQAVDDVRRRVQQDTLGHRGRKATCCTGSATSCAPDTRTSPSDNKPDLTPPSPLASSTSKSNWPTDAPNRSAPSITRPP